MKLSLVDAYTLAVAAGFSRAEAVKMAAIWQAESGLDTQAVSRTNDYGLAQINLTAHPEVTKEQAFNPAFAAQYSRKLYVQRGNSFADWAVYNSGKYLNYISSANIAAAQYAQSAPTYRQKLAAANPDSSDDVQSLSDTAIAAHMTQSIIDLTPGFDLPGWLNPGNVLPDQLTDIPGDIAGVASALADLASYPGKVLSWISDINNLYRVARVVVGSWILIAGVIYVAKPSSATVGGIAKAVT